ncbi:hypothetical protein EC990816_0197, partial [Escherichia coli 99.0816]
MDAVLFSPGNHFTVLQVFIVPVADKEFGHRPVAV